jgi:hypothetical protein
MLAQLYSMTSSHPGQRKLRIKQNLRDKEGKIMHGAVNIMAMHITIEEATQILQ